jgi:predicted O-methyltransferase YrrM
MLEDSPAPSVTRAREQVRRDRRARPLAIVRHLHHASLELVGASTGIAVVVAGLCAAVALAASAPVSTACIAAAAAGLVVLVATRRSARLERLVRNAEDASFVASRAGFPPSAFGTWSIEADFALLVVREIRARETRLLEFGAGSSTLFVAQALKEVGAGRLVTVEHNEAYAEATLAELRRHGVADWVDIVVAPLKWQTFGRTATSWYDAEVVDEALRSQPPIDVVVVDGPPATTAWARWPAVPVVHPHLAASAVILCDDGRRWRTTRWARRWARDYPDLELYWHDTVKGSWRLVKRSTPASGGFVERGLRRGAAAVNPHPTAFGRWPVRR